MSKLLIFTDGGSRGNPGPSAAGVVIKNDKNEIILKVSKYIGETTNNQAEYEALVLALQKAKGIFKSHKVKKGNLECYLDSELVVRHLNHEYKIKDEGLQPLFIKVWNLTLDFDSVKFFHIPREKNKLADEMVNRELDRQERNESLF
ncbi:MAG: ribonuclease HI family protein [Candidatus Pacebacteria bacterium]|nr:ribonuclease HI family protein [Candidatus Paceibacterota bacterium]